MKYWFFILIFSFQSTIVVGQTAALDSLSWRLRQGDKQALFELAPYLNNHDSIIDILGWCSFKTTKAKYAKNILSNTTLFTKQEVDMWHKNAQVQLAELLKTRENEIYFDTLLKHFLITPLNAREIEYHLTYLTPYELRQLHQQRDLLKMDNHDSLNYFIENHNPKALLKAAELLYLTFYDYQEFEDLIQLLTHCRVWIDHGNKKSVGFIKPDWSSNNRRNLLSYWLQHYQDYIWNDSLGYFENKRSSIQEASPVQILFEATYFDSIKSGEITYLELCHLPYEDTQFWIKLYKGRSSAMFSDYEIGSIGRISDFIKLCQEHNLEYQDSNLLSGFRLNTQTKNSIKTRIKLEKELLAQVNFSNIHSLEFAAMVYQNQDEFALSIGSVINQFYCYQWDSIIHNKPNLKIYLLKSNILQSHFTSDHQPYRCRFSASDLKAIGPFYVYKANNKLRNEIEHIPQSIRQSKMIDSLAVNHHISAIKSSFPLRNFEERTVEMLSSSAPLYRKADSIEQWAELIDFSQLGIASKIIDTIDWPRYEPKPSVVFDDFGVPFCCIGPYMNMEKIWQLHDSLSEFEFYSFFADSIGYDYKNSANQLDFDKLYLIFKFGYRKGFYNGPHALNDNEELYCLIKLLELHFETTLSYPSKLYNGESRNNPSDIFYRVIAWIRYLERHQLINEKLIKLPRSYSEVY